jgi:FKBP-type peptidyl-prolyl cis-trans isomerase
MKIFAIVTLSFIILLLGCEEKKTVYEIDDEIIQEYLQKTHLDTAAIKHSSGLYYIIEDEGYGKHPNIYDNIEVITLGYYTDSVVFQTDNAPINGTLSSFIQGWQYGIPLIGKGGKIMLFIPRYLAYNKEVLIFNVELRNVWSKK